MKKRIDYAIYNEIIMYNVILNFNSSIFQSVLDIFLRIIAIYDISLLITTSFIGYKCTSIIELSIPSSLKKTFPHNTLGIEENVKIYFT